MHTSRTSDIEHVLGPHGRPHLFVDVRINIRALKHPTQPLTDLKDVRRSCWGTAVSQETEPMSSSVL